MIAVARERGVPVHLDGARIFNAATALGVDVRQLADKISGAIYCRDDVLQPESLNAYRRLLSADKHHVLTGCAHFPWEENPQAYYRVLFRLLG